MAVFVRCDICSGENANRVCVSISTGHPKIDGIRQDIDLCAPCITKILVAARAFLPKDTR